MRKARGFTLAEVLVAVAIIGVLAAAAFGAARWAFGNATLGRATFDMVQKVRGLRSRAMSDNTDYLFVFADSASNRDALDCGWASTSNCARWWILKNPRAGWSLAAFDPAAPTALADYDDRDIMPRGVRLVTADPAFAIPPPFNVQVTGVTHDALTPNCSGHPCFAIRFTATGRVVPEPRNVSAAGYAFALSAVNRSAGSAVHLQDTFVVMVTYPAGIVKAFTPYTNR